MLFLMEKKEGKIEGETEQMEGLRSWLKSKEIEHGVRTPGEARLESCDSNSCKIFLRFLSGILG